jgi:hypothetical protein
MLKVFMNVFAQSGKSGGTLPGGLPKRVTKKRNQPMPRNNNGRPVPERRYIVPRSAMNGTRNRQANQ